MSVAAELRKQKAKPRAKQLPPLWEGPCGKGPQGGVTQSMLAKYLTCKERFRVRTVEGLKAADRFEARLEFGNLWHAMQEGGTAWETFLVRKTEWLNAKYPLQRSEVAHWSNIAYHLWPRYRDYWAGLTEKGTSLGTEVVFDVPLELPSGRVARLRGKWDGLKVVNPKKGQPQVLLGEYKSKSSIDREKVARQLRFDLQTMFYLVALEAGRYERGIVDLIPKGAVISGVDYDVVRRSAHKSTQTMCEKVDQDVRCGRGNEWFARWQVEVSPLDLRRFKDQCLVPVLENLCDDWEWWEHCHEGGKDRYNEMERYALFVSGRFGPVKGSTHRPRHHVTPFFYNPLADGAGSEYDAYLETGSTAGLSRAATLFPELEA